MQEVAGGLNAPAIVREAKISINYPPAARRAGFASMLRHHSSETEAALPKTILWVTSDP
jgi:hypothetical protein